MSSTQIFKAIVQKFDDVTPSDTWVTRSDDTFFATNYGVKVMKGYLAGEDKKFFYTDIASSVKTVSLYGRY